MADEVGEVDLVQETTSEMALCSCVLGNSRLARIRATSSSSNSSSRSGFIASGLVLPGLDGLVTDFEHILLHPVPVADGSSFDGSARAEVVTDLIWA